MPGDNEFNGLGGARGGLGTTRGLVAPELLPLLDFLPSFDFNEETLRAVRAMTGMDPQRQPPLSAEQQTVDCQQRFIPGPPGAPDVRVLVYTPPRTTASTSRRPAYLHMHGGGYIIGNPELNDGPNRSLAAELDCVVVSVDYRLAPETRFPGAVEDCYAALLWLRTQAEALGVDTSRIAIGGESAGGGHAAALAILARNRGTAQIRLQLLDSPMLDDRTGSGPDPHPYCGEFVWTRNSNRFGWRSLLGVQPGGPDVPVEAVPARVADMTGLPPAFILIGALDLFLEESLEYARRLTRSGVPAELHVIPGGFHGFTLASGEVPQVQACMRLRRDALARALAPDNPPA
jgi:triacylglycerol lipase